MLARVPSKPQRQISIMKNIGLLLSKNGLVMLRNGKSTALLLLSPVVALLFLVLVQHVADGVALYQNHHPPALALPPVAPCFHPDGDCKTIRWLSVGNSTARFQRIVKEVAEQNSLPNSTVQRVGEMEYYELAEHYIEKLRNRTKYFLVFCDQQLRYGEQISLPCRPQQSEGLAYVIVFNNSLFYRSPLFSDQRRPIGKNLDLLSLKTSIDRAIFREHGMNFGVLASDFPQYKFRFANGYNALNNHGAFYLSVPFLINFLLLVIELLREKECQLLKSLLQSGVTRLQYTASWALTQLLINLLLGLQVCLIGKLTPFRLFVSHAEVVLVLGYAFAGMAFASLAALITAVAKDRQSGIAVSYGLVLFAVCMQLFFSGGFLVYAIQTDHPVARLVKSIFSLYPPFHYSSFFVYLLWKCDSHFNALTGKWETGKDFQTSDLFVRFEKQIKFPVQMKISATSLFDELVWLAANITVNLLLAWYIDMVVNQGKPPFFFLSCLGRASRDSYSDQQGIDVRNVHKQYYRGCRPMVKALDSINLRVLPGEIVGLLGHNGAGKSTLLNIISAFDTPTQGSCFVFGKNVQFYAEEIRKGSGSVPQFDVLWGQLTAEEHVQFFSSLRDVACNPECLQSVNLHKKRKFQVQTFSGGMKRRLSLALSTIGEPSLVLLDQPTSGMDPVVRRKVWDLIRSLRADRSIILTTHHMEEAESLSERVVIMKGGRVVANGTTTSLRNSLGVGYRFIIEVAPGCLDQLLQKVMSEQGLAVQNCEENELALRCEEDAIERVACLLEQDWSRLVSHFIVRDSSTLEDLFLKLTRE